MWEAVVEFRFFLGGGDSSFDVYVRKWLRHCEYSLALANALEQAVEGHRVHFKVHYHF